MASQEIPYQVSYFRKRSRSNYLTSLLSISMVLFFLGLFAAMLLFGESFARYAQKSIVMKVFLYDGISGDALKGFEAKLGDMAFIRNYRYVTKEEAGKYLMEKTGEDVKNILDGVNPLMNSFNLVLMPDYINTDSLKIIRANLEEELVVAEVDYPIEMIMKLNQNLYTVSFIFLGVGLILIGIAFYLIFGTIRLSIYAQRLTIRSMQLIGATQAFIRKPFLWNGLLQGIFAGIIACGLVGVSIWLIGKWLATMNLDYGTVATTSIIGLFIGIVLFGLLLGLLGSIFAVNKYLNRNLDELM